MQLTFTFQKINGLKVKYFPDILNHISILLRKHSLQTSIADI